MDKLEQKIISDMEVEGKIMKIFFIVLVVGIIFATGYMLG